MQEKNERRQRKLIRIVGSAAAEGNGCSLPMCLPPGIFSLLFSTVKPQADQEKLHGMIAFGVTSPVWHFRFILNNHTFSPAIFNETDADIFKTKGRRVGNTCGTAHALQELLYSLDPTISLH